MSAEGQWMRRLKAFSECIALINSFNALGTTEIVRVG